MILYSEVTFDLEGFCEISRLTWECSGVKSVRVWCVDFAVWLRTTHCTTKTVRPVIFYRRVWGLSGLENRPTILKSSRVNQALITCFPLFSFPTTPLWPWSPSLWVHLVQLCSIYHPCLLYKLVPHIHSLSDHRYTMCVLPCLFAFLVDIYH